MDNMLDIETKELRSIIGEIYKKAGKEIMPSNELKEHLNYTGEGRSWGGSLYRLTTDKILERVECKPLRKNGRSYQYYKLLPAENVTPSPSTSTSSIQESLPAAENSDDKVKEEFIILNETTKQYEVIKGSAFLNDRISTLLASEDFTLKIFKLDEIAKPERTINRSKVN